MNEHKMWDIVRQFGFAGETESIAPFGRGHINDTYSVSCTGGYKYILQRINVSIFRHPEDVMNNIEQVTLYLRDKIRERGGDERRETLHVLRASDGRTFITDNTGEVWRAYDFIPNSVSCDIVRNAGASYRCGIAFGSFERDLADFPVDRLKETIPNFHYTPARYDNFEQAVRQNFAMRAEGCSDEIHFLEERAACRSELTDGCAAGKLPVRVTHNDTKINNVLFDRVTGEILAVVDLDTVMPGLTAYAFGDMLRSGAATGAEDEADLSKVGFDISKFEGYLRGYIEGCGGALTKEEIRVLPRAAYVITYEQALRFLEDHLNGDIYYKISVPGHNLIRARTQIRLLSEMEKYMDEMQRMTAAYL